MRTAAEMREVIAAWEGSELTQREFAEQNGLSYTAFQYWRRRLKELDGTAAPDIVPLRIVADESRSSGRNRGIEVRIGDDVSLVVVPGFDEGHLRRVVAAIRAC